MKNLYNSHLKICQFALLLLAAIIIHGCKKDHSLTPDISTGSIAAEMKQWLTQQKTDSISAGKLLSQTDWPNAHSLTADSGKTYEVAPLVSTTIFDDSTKTQKRYLVLQKQNDKIISGFIYEIFGNKTDITGKADQLIKNFDQQRIDKFNGTATIYSWNNSIKKSKTFINGITTSYLNVISKQHLDKTSIQDIKQTNGNGPCVDWYMDTYVNGELIDEQYIGTSCGGHDACAIEGIRNGKGNMAVKMNCGGSGGTNHSNVCAADEQTALNEALSDPDNTSDGSSEDLVDPFHKSVTYNWTCLKGVFGSWAFHSSEVATEYSSDGVHDWRYTGFSHQTAYMSGAPLAGSITISVTGATPSVSDYQATMNLSLYELSQFSCEGFNVQTSEKTETASKTWHL